MKIEAKPSFAADYRWREKVKQQAYQERYYPHGKDNESSAEKVDVIEIHRPIPNSGSIDFRT